MAPPDPADLLAALPVGKMMWIEARGRSMWPLLWPGDRLRAVRCEATTLKMGHVAVLSRSDGALVCHGVVSARPLRTASLSGTIDDCLVPLARVDAVRRGTREWSLPRVPVQMVQKTYSRIARSWLPSAWQFVVRFATGASTRRARRMIWAPVVVRLPPESFNEAIRVLSRWRSPPSHDLAPTRSECRVAGVRLRSGALAGVAFVHEGTLKHAFLSRRVHGLGLETELIALMIGPDLVCARIAKSQEGFLRAVSEAGIPTTVLPE